jgi:hypothetical protein
VEKYCNQDPENYEGSATQRYVFILSFELSLPVMEPVTDNRYGNQVENNCQADSDECCEITETRYVDVQELVRKTRDKRQEDAEPVDH